MERETKLCPYCGGEILAVAKKCKHCGRWLTEEARPVRPKADDCRKRWFVGIGITAAIVLAALAAFIVYHDSCQSHDVVDIVYETAGEEDSGEWDFGDECLEDESAEPEECDDFVSPDLGTLFLHGHVRTMVEYREDNPEYKDVFMFDSDGRLVEYHNKYGGDEDADRIVRKNGRIASLGSQTCAAISVTEFAYNNDGTCILSNCHSGHGTDEYVFTSFDERGCPTFARKSGAYCHMGDDEDWVGTATFSYSCHDAHGNWTRCVRQDEDSITRRVYDDEGDGFNVVNEARHTSATIVREITHYP